MLFEIFLEECVLHRLYIEKKSKVMSKLLIALLLQYFQIFHLKYDLE